VSIFDDTRTDWGARPPTSIKTVPITNRTEFFTHWNGGPVGLFGKGHDACLRAVRADQEFHMASRGWSDIGYNGLVCVHARAIAGRGLYAAGTHCPNHNTSGLGMQFMVGKGETATPAMFARMRRLYDDCCDQAGRRLTQRGPSDASPTECPGAQILTWTHQGMPTTTTQEDDMPTPDDLIRADVVPSPDGSKDNPTWSLATYIPAIYRNARAAFQQASAARAIAEAQAAKGAALTADEIKAAAKAGAGEALADGLDAHITLTPKETP
jgi:hypothetical protein